MIRFLPALLLCGALSCTPAQTAEYVIDIGSASRLQAVCQRLGIWQAAVGQTPGSCIASGTLSRNGESYFLNAIGIVYAPTGATAPDQFGNPQPVIAAIPGYWLRVRYNGAVPAAILATPPAGVTIYKPCALNPDGTQVDATCSQPAYGGIL